MTAPFLFLRIQRLGMKTRAIIELLIATATWGFGFLATRWALESWGPVGMGAWRFGLAAIIGAVWIWTLSLRRGSDTRAWDELKSLELWKISFLPGIFLAGTLGLQTAGLQYTSITNSSFLTVLYVPMMPILQWAIFKVRATPRQLACVALGLVGTVLLTQFRGFASFNVGDALTIACAFMAAGHIITVGIASQRLCSALAFNLGQSGLASVMSFVLLPLFGEAYLPSEITHQAFWGMAFLILMSSLVAFTLQAKAQRDLDPTTASLIFLLEGPFASGFAFLILGEKISAAQWLGAGVIFVSAAIASRAKA